MNDFSTFALVTLDLLAGMSILLYVLTKLDPQTQTQTQTQAPAPATAD